MNGQLKRYTEWHQLACPCGGKGPHPPGRGLSSPSQKLSWPLVHGGFSEVSLGRSGWWDHVVPELRLQPLSPRSRWGAVVHLLVWLVFLGTGPILKLSRPCSGGHLSSIEKMVDYKGFKSSETWDKDRISIFYHTTDISWSFTVVFTKCSFILVFKKSHVFSHA